MLHLVASCLFDIKSASYIWLILDLAWPGVGVSRGVELPKLKMYFRIMQPSYEFQHTFPTWTVAGKFLKSFKPSTTSLLATCDSQISFATIEIIKQKNQKSRLFPDMCLNSITEMNITKSELKVYRVKSCKMHYSWQLCSFTFCK